MDPQRPLFDPKELRKHVLHMAHRGQSVHVSCAFSLIELVSVLYSKYLKFNPADARDPARDYLVLSKGHGVMALYACFRQIGWLPQKALDEYFSEGSHLRGLSEADIPGLEVTSGSLGHGLPIATGMAYGLKLRNDPRKVVCIVGDGEMNEGSMWEALLFAGHHRLDNLLVIVDGNQFQAMGKTESILSLEPLPQKFASFGFEAAECDGHSVPELERTLDTLFQLRGKPKALVARTIKGKGISFMEGDNKWHYTRISAETLGLCLQELN